VASSIIYGDNQSTGAMAHNPVLHAWTKHMEIDLFFVREKVLAKQINVAHQTTDIPTKPLSTTRFLELHVNLNVAHSLSQVNSP
jgi:hypothetical protein